MSVLAKNPRSTQTDFIKKRAREMGFHCVGISSPQVDRRAQQAFRLWLASGYHASMKYLERDIETRLDPQRFWPQAKSAIVLGVHYNRIILQCEGQIARYALGEDYHSVITEKCEQLVEWIRQTLDPTVVSRICVDTAPILERALAVQAGLGFQGKNGLLISTQGSYLFLAIVFTNLELDVDQPVPAQCGSCGACLNACPTQALRDVGAIHELPLLDANRCIAYWTVEHRGSIPSVMCETMGDHLFGCDRCQEVCPWNDKKGFPFSIWKEFRAGGVGEIPRLPDGQDEFPLRNILSIRDDARFLEIFGRTAMKRARREGLVRNACIVAGNLRRRDLIGLLRECMEHDSSEVVRETARWAIGQIGKQVAAFPSLNGRG